MERCEGTEADHLHATSNPEAWRALLGRVGSESGADRVGPLLGVGVTRLLLAS
jgi:hypothetical protein